MERLTPHSLVLATDIDTLPPDRLVVRREGYLAVRSPSNPTHHWGTLLVFDDPPADGDGERWEAAWAAEMGDDPRIRHRTFAWDRIDGEEGAAASELASRGYEVEESVALVAAPDEIRCHPRESREVEIHALDPTPGGPDEDLWRSAIELEMAGRDPIYGEEGFRAYVEQRQTDRRALFLDGRGAWFVATLPGSREAVAGCGIVVTAGRGRYQSVETAEPFRRKGICSRLLVEAARHATEVDGAERFVIVADPGYHAIGLYESLGFVRREHVIGASWFQREIDESY